MSIQKIAAAAQRLLSPSLSLRDKLAIAGDVRDRVPAFAQQASDYAAFLQALLPAVGKLLLEDIPPQVEHGEANDLRKLLLDVLLMCPVAVGVGRGVQEPMELHAQEVMGVALQTG